MPYTLLLADDSVTIQRVIELTFADEDITVIAVSDGDQAIERLEASPPDIVLADIGMPGKNGYEVAQYIHQSPGLSHIPVVLLTGAFEPVDQERVDAAGCEGVLAKPFEPQLVIGRVKELLARPRRGPEPHAPESRAGAREAATPASSPALPGATGSDESWVSVPPEAFETARFPGAPGHEPPPVMPPAELNDYFDRLDAAFSKLSPNAPAPAPPPVENDVAGGGAPVETEANWFSSAASEGGSSEPWDLPAPPADVVPGNHQPLTDAPPPPATPLDQAALQEWYAAVQDVEPVPGIAPVAEIVSVVEVVPVVEAAPAIQEPPNAATASNEHTAPMEEAAHMVAAPTSETGPIVEVDAPPDERLAPIEESAPIVESARAEESPALHESSRHEELAHVEESPRLDERAPIAESAPAEESQGLQESARNEDRARIHDSAPVESARIEADSTASTPAEAPAGAPVAPGSWDVTSSAAASAPAAPALELPLPNRPPLPALADAFAALLAAEQAEPSAGRALWPSAPHPPAAGVSEDVIDAITRRVLDRLSDTVVRDAVSDIVPKIAERLIQEEIERIKASIK